MHLSMLLLFVSSLASLAYSRIVYTPLSLATTPITFDNIPGSQDNCKHGSGSDCAGDSSVGKTPPSLSYALQDEIFTVRRILLPRRCTLLWRSQSELL
jgi:hypothetical protein